MGDLMVYGIQQIYKPNKIIIVSNTIPSDVFYLGIWRHNQESSKYLKCIQDS